ncbi:MAG: hypothetical protein ABI158_12665 [Edaphobacter sp.]
MWNLDVWLPFGVALLANVALEFLPREQSKKVRNWRRAVGIVICALVLWQAIRSGKAQKPLANLSIDRIESAFKPNQSGLPAVQRWLVANHDIDANIYFRNDGPAAAEKFKGYGRIYLVSSDPRESDAMKTAEKMRDIQMLMPKFVSSSKEPLTGVEGAPLAPTGRETVWFTAHSERPITQTDIDNLQSGAELFFLFYTVQYSDPAGAHRIHGCRIAQTPSFNPEIWQFCDAFQDHL